MMAQDKSDGRKKPPLNRILMIAAAAAGILLLVFGGFAGTADTKNDTAYTDVGFYTEYLEKRIRTLCLSVEGITEAEVFLTVDCSSEYIYGEGGDYLILSGGEEAVMLCEIYPKVRGIAVVCTGGNSAVVRETVTRLLSAALDLPSSKIEVAGG